MAMKRLAHHPASKIFPMLSDAELDDLAGKLKESGLLEEIVLLDGEILDGRNRDEACFRAGVAPRYVDFHKLFGTTPLAMSPTAWVLAKNLDRRHLNESQRAVAAMEALPLLEAEARKRMAAGGGNKRVAPRGATRCGDEVPARGGGLAHCTQEPGHFGPHRYSAPVLARSEVKKLEKAAKATKKADQGKAAAVAAKAVGASTRSVERAKAVATKRPELIEQVKAAKLSLKQAEKAIRKDEALKNVLVYRPPLGSFAVIVTDVSWEYDDKLDGPGARGGIDYAAQKLDEIMAMKIPAAADCALWFWVTNAFLIDGTAARVLVAWGFEPKALLTWRKVDKAGADRLGSGHYLQNNTEHVILAVRGKPMIVGAGQPSFFEGQRTSTHSEKPARFFEIAERVTPCAPEARIELNARKKRPGWNASGADLQKESERLRVPPEPELIDTMPIDDGTLCGVRPSKSGAGCIHKQGHNGVHSNGHTTWRDRKKRFSIDYVDEREAKA